MKRSRTYRLTGLVAIGFAAVAASITCALAEMPGESVYTGSKRAVEIEVYKPNGKGPYLAVLSLHGGSGMNLYGADFRARAKEFTDRGFVALIPHYFDATGSHDSPEITQ